MLPSLNTRRVNSPNNGKTVVNCTCCFWGGAGKTQAAGDKESAGGEAQGPATPAKRHDDPA